MINKIKTFCKQEVVLVAALVLALLSSFYSFPKIEYIDFAVLGILLSLMLVIAGLKQIHFLDWAAVLLVNRAQNMHQLILILVAITYVSSMFVTNDVALITFVPLALVIGHTIKRDMIFCIILQTLAANLGSMLTPPGNPQNLFLYSFFNYTPLAFFKVMALPCLFSICFLWVMIVRRRNRELNLALEVPPKPEQGQMLLYFGLMFLNIAAVLHVLSPYIALVITVLAVLVNSRKLLLEVDYSLLVTFIGFFVFIGNISHAPLVLYLKETLLGSAEGSYVAAIVASQFISNVPAAMLLSGLTHEADALLLGVNVGGLGTLIASMASVISYKLFVAEHPYLARTYLKTFLYCNFVGLAILGTVIYVVAFKLSGWM